MVYCYPPSQNRLFVWNADSFNRQPEIHSELLLGLPPNVVKLRQDKLADVAAPLCWSVFSRRSVFAATQCRGYIWLNLTTLGIRISPLHICKTSYISRNSTAINHGYYVCRYPMLESLYCPYCNFLVKNVE